MISSQPIVQSTQSTPAPIPAEAPAPKAAPAPVKTQAVATPAAKVPSLKIDDPAVLTSVFINPKTLRTVAKLTNALTGEIIGFIPPKIVSASYSAAAANAEPGLVTSGYS